VCLSFGVIAANAQIKFHAGVTAGVAITDTLSSSTSNSVSGQDYSLIRFHSDTKRLLIGPAFRLDLTKVLGLEFDALYQRVDYDSANINTIPEIRYFYQSFAAVHADRWQFPLLVQYSCGPQNEALRASGSSDQHDRQRQRFFQQYLGHQSRE
jgi:hypothetical protein